MDTKCKAVLLIGMAVLVIGSVTVSGSSWAFQSPSAREWGLGGSYVAVARGVEAIWTNPANLAMPGGDTFSLSLISLNTGLSNNSLTLDQYNQYTSGVTLSEADKQDILGAIPEDGFRVRADVGANALGFSVGRCALAATPRLSASVGVARDYFDLLLNGNEVGRSYSITDNDGEGFAVVELGGAYAQPFAVSWAQSFAVGVGVKYLVGLGYGEVVESSGQLRTDPASATTAGRIVALYAGETREEDDGQGGTREEYEAVVGRGIAIDLGASAKIGEAWTVSAVLADLSPGIVWPKGTRRGFVFSADSLTAETAGDDLFESDDTLEHVGSFTSPYPGAFRLGVMRETRTLLVAADYEQGFSTFAGRTTTPRLSAGTEYSAVGWLPLRVGLSLGGGLGPTLAGGFGLHLGPWDLDLAARNRGLSGGSSKGLAFALATSLHF